MCSAELHCAGLRDSEAEPDSLMPSCSRQHERQEHRPKRDVTLCVIFSPDQLRDRVFSALPVEV
jgi:hypothetical protein